MYGSGRLVPGVSASVIALYIDIVGPVALPSIATLSVTKQLLLSQVKKFWLIVVQPVCSHGEQ